MRAVKIAVALSAMLFVVCAVTRAQSHKNPEFGLQFDTHFEEDINRNPAWTRLRFNEPDKDGESPFSDFGRCDYRETAAGYEERFGLQLPLNIGRFGYNGSIQLFGIKTAMQEGAGFNVYGSMNDWIIGAVFEGAETHGDNDRMYGIQLGRHFETCWGKGQAVFGYFNMAGAETGSVFLYNSGPDNMDCGLGFKFDEEGSETMAISVGRYSPAFQGTTWRVFGKTDFNGNFSGRFHMAMDPQPNYRYFVYGAMNPIDGFTDVSLVPNIMNFPDIQRHERGRKLVLELGYDRMNNGENAVSFGSTVYPLKLMGDTGNIRPHIGFETKHSTDAESYQRYGGGVLVGLAGDGRESTTNLLDIGVFTDSEGITTGFLQIVKNF